jgi:urea transport system permease protein
MRKKGGQLVLIEVGVVVAIALILILVMPVVLSGFRLTLLGRFFGVSDRCFGY